MPFVHGTAMLKANMPLSVTWKNTGWNKALPYGYPVNMAAMTVTAYFSSVLEALSM